MLQEESSEVLAGFELQDEKEVQVSELESEKPRTSPSKTRSFSDAGLPALSVSSLSKESLKQAWRDDIAIENCPVDSQKPSIVQRGLSLKMPPCEFKPPSELVPVSPNLEKCTTNVLPRRSRGMDFSRAATNLHHSTLANRSSPDSSPITANRSINMPCRIIGPNSGGCGDFLHNPSPLWSNLGHADQINFSNSSGSINMMGSDPSESCTDEDDLMDDVDDTILTTPQVKYFGGLDQDVSGDYRHGQSLSPRSPINLHRAGRRDRIKRNLNSGGINAANSSNSNSSLGLHNNDIVQEPERTVDLTNARRDSTTCAANKLRISGHETDDAIHKYNFDNIESQPITPSRDVQRGVIRRPVTRRGNMLPKTKGFARIQVALAEESAPVETEVLREAEVVRQTRESEIDLESRQLSISIPRSPVLAPITQKISKALEENREVFRTSAPESSFKEKDLHNLKSDDSWETSGDELNYHTPVTAAFPYTSTDGTSTDMQLDSPLKFTALSSNYDSTGNQSSSTNRSSTPQPGSGSIAVDISQKLSKKRLRDDDFDLYSFKRRAVSPSMSAHNSPIIQSPMHRDHPTWGNRVSGSCNIADSGKLPINSSQKRIGLQGMNDTNDGLMKMSIE
ncbi:hypothetical protein GcM3_178016 [Golovinomyces cichoracearum]|uniref:Uncharacterized protein n=1 Tax=Golovinomyces cichoracearum TaxID=62708 RepID=A0A420HNH5_9PEZI|nr:hypothetical protein GcM3_178016 [Golovinomyces cichoracearum]